MRGGGSSVALRLLRLEVQGAQVGAGQQLRTSRPGGTRHGAQNRGQLAWTHRCTLQVAFRRV